MINLIKSGIVCLVSMFLSEIGFIRKTRCNRNYLFKPISANISTERKQYVVVHMFINKTKCNRKICSTYSKQLVQTCISTEKKVCLVHFYMASCREQENKSQLYVFSKVQEWFCPDMYPLPTADKMLNLESAAIGCTVFPNQYPGKLTKLAILKVQKFEQFLLFMY